MRLVKLGGLGTVSMSLTLLILLSSSEPLAQSQPDCTVTVQPGQPLQNIIDKSPQDAVICLAAGKFRESLDIKKSLVLRGVGHEPTQIESNTGGPVIFITGDVTVTLENLAVFKARGIMFADGIHIKGKAKVTILNSLVFDNEWGGLAARGSSHARLVRTLISGNGLYGIRLQDSASVEIQSSIIENNGVNEGCRYRDSYKRYHCNGLLLSDNSRLMLADSSILRNADWGLAAILQSCKYADLQVNVGRFTGQVSFQGVNKIEGNNTSGYLNGMGNPGNHPWNRPDIPDGQVCLP